MKIPPTATRHRISRHSAGFTLMELLTVIAIIVIIATFVAPATNTILRGSQLTQAGQTVVGQLGMARQMALAKNRAVEVRLYQYCDPDSPAERGKPLAEGKFRAMQLFEILSGTTGSATTAKPLTKVQKLPATVIFDSGATLSSIIGNNSVKTGNSLGVNIPRVNLNYNAITFQFRSDGSTTLSKAQSKLPWFVTMHAVTEGDKLATAPANYSSIQIDPYNGEIKEFRP